MIAGTQRQRPFQAHLHHARLADREGRLVVQKHNAAEYLGRARHDVHARTRSKNAGSHAIAPHICQLHQKAQRLAHATLDAEHLAAFEARHAIVHQVQGDALAGNRALGIPVNLPPRTRQRVCDGSATSSSPTETGPSCSVPVTTVPVPRMLKQRSMGRRGAAPEPTAASRCSDQHEQTALSSAVSGPSRPSPVLEDTGTIEAPANTVPSRNASTSRSRSVSRKSVRTSNSTWSCRTRVTTGVSGS